MKINKEAFKIAMSECLKKSWIFSNLKNYSYAVKLNKENKIIYNIQDDMEKEDNFSSDSTNIDLFNEYVQNNLKSKQEKDDFLIKWNDAWEDEDGFVIDKFFGDAIEDGNEFGTKVIEFFEAKHILNFTNKKTFNLSHMNFKEARTITNQIMKEQEKYKYLYEPAFVYKTNNYELTTRCDVLKLNGNNHVEIFEAKATTKVKKEHFFDLLFQIFILEKLGYIVDDVKIVHLNKNYFKNNNDYTIKNTEVDFKNFAESFEKIDFYDAYKELNNLNNNKTNIIYEDIDLNELIIIDEFTFGESSKKDFLYCDIKSAMNTIDFDYVFNELARVYNLSEEEVEKFLQLDSCNLFLNKKSKKWIKYDKNYNEPNQNCFHAMKYFSNDKTSFLNLTGLKKSTRSYIINNSPSPFLIDYDSLDDNSIPLKQIIKNKKIITESFFSHKHHRIFDTEHNKEKIKKDISYCLDEYNLNNFISVLNNYKKKTIYMYDFETVKFAVPKFNKTNPYMQIPFQYSIDIIKNIDDFDYNDLNTMFHEDFLSKHKNDPRRDFIIKFLNDIFKYGDGVYVAYNDSFEKGVLIKLAYLFREYAIPIMYIVQNTIDLLDFFKGNSKKDLNWFLIYHPNFKGSYSIKKTQPALEPNFSYEDLTINNGLKSSETFRKFLENRIPDKIWNEYIYADMLKYCNRDTLAMVVLLKKIIEIYNAYKQRKKK